MSFHLNYLQENAEFEYFHEDVLPSFFFLF